MSVRYPHNEPRPVVDAPILCVVLAGNRATGVGVSRELIDLLKSGPCVDCNLTFPSWAMTFDHVRGVKRFNVSEMVGHSREQILAEVSLCEVVCATCHAIREQFRKLDQHVDAALDADLDAELVSCEEYE